MIDQATVIEVFKVSLPIIGAIIGAGAALLGGILSDGRKAKQERLAVAVREKTLLTGMYVVRNHITQCLKQYEENGRVSALQPLRSAHRYVDKLIDKTPPHGEALLMAVVEIGLKLDALFAIIDRRTEEPALNEQLAFARAATAAMNELITSLGQFDAVAEASLSFIGSEDLEAIIRQSRSAKA